jgi:toxin ParE1/3/4
VEQIVIVITDSALSDLEDIERYISEDSPSIARKFISKIFDKIEQLSAYPESGKPVPEIKDPLVRELLINKFVLFTSLLTIRLM